MLRKTLTAMTLGTVMALAPMAASVAVAQEEKEKVIIARSTDSLAFIGLFAAIAQDTFSKNGIEAEFVRAGSGSKTVAAVVGGSADIVVGATSGSLYALKEGVDMKMFGLLTNQYSSNIVYSKEWAAKHNLTTESPLADKLAALKGIRITTSGPGAGEHIIRYVAALAGLNPDRDMTITHLGNEGASMVAAMQEGRIDAISLSAPTTNIAMNDLGAILAVNSMGGEVEQLRGYPYIGIMAKNEFFEQRPEAVKRLQKAFQDALDYMHNPETTLETRDKIRAEFYPDLDPALFEGIWTEAVAGTAKSIKFDPAALELVINMLNEFEENKLDLALIPRFVDESVIAK